MTLAGLAWANIRSTPVTSALNVGLLALGTASIVVLLLLSRQIGDTLTRDASDVDLVLGAKGSPIQLVLSAVYHADIPTGNVTLGEANEWAQDRRVSLAIPLSLGDSARGFRIVGTTLEYPSLYDAEIEAGRFWESPMEAVAGSAVAEATDLSVGAQLYGSHGMMEGGAAHAEAPYRIVGVLAPTGTVLDRLILTSLESVWAIHRDEHKGDDEHDAELEHGDVNGDTDEDVHDARRGHNTKHGHDAKQGHDVPPGPAQGAEPEGSNSLDHEASESARQTEGRAHHLVDESQEITAMLIGYRSPIAAASLPREINMRSNLQAAAPAFELARVLQFVGLGANVLRGFSITLIIAAALSILGAMYNALQSRLGELSMMRCLGATQTEVMGSLLIEGSILAALGAAIGLFLGHSAVELMGRALQASRGVAMTGGTFVIEELYLAIAMFAVTLLAVALPATQIYRTDISRTLARRA